jgi:hypothetical protein
MSHVTTLAQHILTLEPDKDAARLCFYHYLKNLCEAVEPVTSELVNRFFARALTFQHWQQNKLVLFNEVNGILQHFQETTHQLLPLEEVYRPEDLQVVPVESARTLELVVNKYLERHSSPYDQYRALTEGDRMVSIVLQGDRSLRVNVFPRVLAIREGELVPLTQDFQLHYNSDLQLQALTTQQLEIGPHTSARFRLTPAGIEGVIVRGYTFQKYSTMEGGLLHRYPILFYPLKRLEQFFVNRKSDPMYIELTGLLEKALELMNQEHPEGSKFAEAALERGRLALEHIFPDDKLVRLLINNLEKTLALESARRGEPVSAPAQQNPQTSEPDYDYPAVAGEELEEIDLAGATMNQNSASFHQRSPNQSSDETSRDPKDNEWPTIRNLPV